MVFFLHEPGFRRVVEQEVLLVDFSVGCVDGDDWIANLIGPWVHHLGNIDVSTIRIYGLKTCCKLMDV